MSDQIIAKVEPWEVLHKLWTMAVGAPGYDKRLWLALERAWIERSRLKAEPEPKPESRITVEQPRTLTYHIEVLERAIAAVEPNATLTKREAKALITVLAIYSLPIPMILYCPPPPAGCGARHIDVGEFATKPHHTHACQHCGAVWRQAIGNTVGVQFLPGFKDPSNGG